MRPIDVVSISSGVPGSGKLKKNKTTGLNVQKYKDVFGPQRTNSNNIIGKYAETGQPANTHNQTQSLRQKMSYL